MSTLFSLLFVCAAALPAGPVAPSRGPAVAPDRAIEAAVRERVGDDAAVHVRLVEPVDGLFTKATLDPLARTGRAAVFTLTPDAAGARPVRVRAEVTVERAQVVARTAILRGHTVTAGDVSVSSTPAAGLPFKRLPSLDQIVGQPALRPIAAGQVIEPGFVAVRRAVQAGDTVTVLAIVGAVQVSASLVAADAGDPGDVVRVVNPATRRTLRARVIEPGIVEVLRERR